MVIFTNIYINTPSHPIYLSLSNPLIRPSLLSSASRFRRPSARRRRHPLPCLFSSLNRASFPLTKTLPPSPSLSTDFSSLPLRNPAADSGGSGGLPPYLFLLSLSVFSTSSKILCSFPSSPS